MDLPKPNGPERELGKVLRDWEVREPLPPRFGERVWQRIAREEAQGVPNIWRLLADWLNGVMSRPSRAVSYLTVLLLAGVLAGYWHARQDNTRALENLGARYVQMMEPFQSGHP